MGTKNILYGPIIRRRPTGEKGNLPGSRDIKGDNRIKKGGREMVGPYIASYAGGTYPGHEGRGIDKPNSRRKKSEKNQISRGQRELSAPSGSKNSPTSTIMRTRLRGTARVVGAEREGAGNFFQAWGTDSKGVP